MAITTLLDPTLLPARTMDQAPFDAAMAYLMSNLPIAFSQMNATEAGMNAAAAGGAYAISLIAGNDSQIGLGAGRVSLSPNSGGQNAAGTIFIDGVDSSGNAIRSILDDLYAGAVNANTYSKGYVRLVKVGDPSKWITYRIVSWTFVGGAGNYGWLGVVCTGYSTANPFVGNDAVVAYFQRTGDVGAAGASGIFPSVYVRYEAGVGVSSDTLTGGTWTTRQLNTVKWNDVSGASLASNQITLPAGTFEIEASAPATSTNGHKVRLWNVTDSVSVEIGTAGYAINSGGMSRSHLRCRLTVPAGTSKTYRLDHYAANGAGMTGVGTAIEVYSELKASKIA